MNTDFNLKTIIKSKNNSEQKTSKKSVKFDDDTIFIKGNHIALTISEHKYIKYKGYTQYFIRLLYRGVEWHLSKRYSDFNDLHNALVKENLKYKIELPKLPMKRWFESNRWLNRTDDSYSETRRKELQIYLRALTKLPILMNESLHFWTFICMPKRAMLGAHQFDEKERKVESIESDLKNCDSNSNNNENETHENVDPDEFVDGDIEFFKAEKPMLRREDSILATGFCMNTVFDDDGNEVLEPQEQIQYDPEFIASSNAILNTRLTAKDMFINNNDDDENTKSPIEYYDPESLEFDDNLHFCSARSMSFDSAAIVSVVKPRESTNLLFKSSGSSRRGSTGDINR